MTKLFWKPNQLTPRQKFYALPRYCKKCHKELNLLEITRVRICDKCKSKHIHPKYG